MPVGVCSLNEPIIHITESQGSHGEAACWCMQAAFRAEQEAALKAAEKQNEMPGAFTDCAQSPGMRTRAQARKML